MAKSLNKSEFSVLASNSYIVGTPTATTIIYGNALSASIISGITGTSAVGELSAAINGVFAFTSASYIPNTTSGSLYEITFTPTLSNFNVATVNASVAVNQAASVITVLPTALNIVYLNTLSNATLTGGSGTPSGTFAFENSAYVVKAIGTESVGIIFTPTNTNYAISISAVNITSYVSNAQKEFSMEYDCYI